MWFLIILLTSEILTLVVIRQHFYDRSWMRYYLVITLNSILSIWLWILWFETVSYNGIFDEPSHIWMIMSLAGMISGVVIPRVIVTLFHFTGVALRRKAGGHSRILTNTGMIISLILFLVVLSGSLFGKFNIKTDRITVRPEGSNPELNGLKIVLISDLHLSSFYHHKDFVIKVMNRINQENPDLLINTGDFVSFGWREFGKFDTILRIAKGKYGNYAVMGNHDFGTYHPYFTEADKNNNVLHMNKLITLSGYKVLNDESVVARIGKTRIALAGVTTKGSFAKIIHGDLKKALSGTDTSDFKILLAHDPNQWRKEVTGNTDIDLTLSGHTHGMQIGILSKRLKWSPAKYFYPNWNGLYKKGEQFLIVNRGLGVLGIPFRICMPPEITVITLRTD